MTEPTGSAESPETASAPASPPRSKRRWKLILAGIVVVPILVATLYTALVLNWSYSDGDRSGMLYKFSRKGWICKTWEGELNITPGAASPTIWPFTVRDQAVAKQINEALGSKVVLHYSEHVGIPTTCFGDTRYYVNAVRVVPN